MVLKLHFIYAGHFEEETGLQLWRKIAELRRRGIQPLFVGVELFPALRNQRQQKEKEQEERRARLSVNYHGLKPAASNE